MFAHIHDGAGETTDVKQRLQKGTTDTGNVRFAIVESEFKWTNQRFRGDADKKRYFCALLALTQAMVYDDHWMYDNECREQRAKIIGGTYDSLTGCFARRLGRGRRSL